MAFRVNVVTAEFARLPEDECLEVEDICSLASQHSHDFTEFARASSLTVVKITDWSDAACNTALSDLTVKVRRSYAEMVIGDLSNGSLQFAFDVGSLRYSETDFYQRLVDRNAQVSAALRQLILAYLDQIGDARTSQPAWQGGGVPALGSAMRALLLLDPTAIDVFKVYLEKRDGEHEGYTRTSIMPDFIAAHGWSSVERVRFGIFHYINTLLGGYGAGPLDEIGLVTAASKYMTAQTFASLIIEEIDAALSAIDEPDEREEYVLYVSAALLPDDKYQLDVKTVLLEHLD